MRSSPGYAGSILPAEGLALKEWSTVLTWSRTGCGENESQAGAEVWHGGSVDHWGLVWTGNPGTVCPVWSQTWRFPSESATATSCQPVPNRSATVGEPSSTGA